MLRCLLVTAVLATLSGCSLFAPRDSIGVEGVRALLAWTVSKASLPGFSQEPGTAWIFDRAQRVFVVCDWIDAAFPLSDDVRVIRIASADFDRLWRVHGFDRTVWVYFDLIPEYQFSEAPLPPHSAIQMRYSFGNAGAHRYHFAFWHGSDGLQCAGFLVDSS